MEDLKSEAGEGYADINSAREYGCLKMGEHNFEDFVDKFTDNDLAIRTINGRLATKNNNVHILTSANTPEDLSVVQAAILRALDNPEICVAAIISEYQDKPDLETALAFSRMRGKVFYQDLLDRESLIAYSQAQPKSLLLVSQPNVLSSELSESHFGYRWHTEFNSLYQVWRVGDIEVITKMS